MMRTKSPLSKTEGTTDSRTDQRTQGHLSAAIVLTQVPEATQTGTANTAALKSRIIPKKREEKESQRISHVKTNKDMPTGHNSM
jgi:hypothetical protein